MSDFVHDKLLHVIRCGLEIDKPSVKLNEQDISKLLQFASMQSLQLIIIRGLKQFDLDTEMRSMLDNQYDQNMVLYMFHMQAMEDITEAFNESKIPFIPLKGSVIRELYSEPCLRSSCDIDILVHEKDLDRAIDSITKNTNLEYKDRNYHDVLLADEMVSLELHFSLKENMDNIDKLLVEAWKNAAPTGDGYAYAFSPEFLMYHVLAHMSYHMVHGGLGVRPFIDLWLMRKKLSYDEEKLRSMCNECNILRFYESSCMLADHWFNGKHLPDDLRIFEKYCLDGGVFGTNERAAAANRRDQSGIAYAFHRIFLKKSVLEDEFPELRDKPYLWLPCQFKRWLRVLNKEKRQGEFARIKQAAKTDKNEIEEFDGFLRSLGL